MDRMTRMTRTTRRSLLLGPLALLVALVPAFAGTVYLPVSANRTAGSVTYQTRLWLSNPGTAARQVSIVFLPAGTDGTQRGTAKPQTLSIGANATLLLTNLGPDGTSGLLEITGAPQILATAHLEGLDAQHAVAATAYLPAISSKNLVAKNGTADLLGLSRSDNGPVTNLGLVNLGQQVAQCTVRATLVNGAALGGAAVVTVPPVSVRRFEDALGSLGVSAVSDARLSATCDKDFSAFAEVLGTTSPGVLLVSPTVSLDSTLAPPGSGPLPGDSVVVQRTGTFFIATTSASALSVPLPLVAKRAYGKATIEFDMTTAVFSPAYDSILGFVRQSGHGASYTLYFGFNIRGSRGKTFIDLGVPILDPTITASFPWQQRTPYHIKIVYDVTLRKMTLQASQGGVVLHNLSGGIYNLDMSDQGSGLALKFGLAGIADEAFFPPWGYTFSNLRAQIDPL
jgi:hypothetical protein